MSSPPTAMRIGGHFVGGVSGIFLAESGMERELMNVARAWLMGLQDRICEALEEVDSVARFQRARRSTPTGGMARPRVLEEGPVIEKAAVNFSHSVSGELPGAATQRRPELAGKPYEAASVSLIVHPRNPYAPTSHANFRVFMAGDGDQVIWWFGGGFDLTPYYGFEEDCIHWHEQAHAACEPHGNGLYQELKDWCDRYFYLPHRNEPRGVGGIFFDDYQRGGLDRAMAFWQSAGEHYLPAYMPILWRRKDMPFGERERAFQEYRRGRYVEFNLLHDRGTRFGLQAKGPVESILASMPPVARWRYGYTPDPGTAEAELTEKFLAPKDWLAART